MASPEAITDFLEKFKRRAQNKFCFVQRKKNLDTLVSMRITVREAREIILELTPGNYRRGPLQDRNKPHSKIWIFETKSEDQNLYIKLSDNFDYEIAKCISFHPKEFK